MFAIKSTENATNVAVDVAVAIIIIANLEQMFIIVFANMFVCLFIYTSVL